MAVQRKKKPERLESTLALLNQWRDRFLELYGQTGNLTASARAVGVTRQAVIAAAEAGDVPVLVALLRFAVYSTPTALGSRR